MSDHEDIDRIFAMAGKIRTAMLVTRGAEGPHARPMSAIVKADERLVWFLTSADSAKEWEIEADGTSAVTFSDGGNNHVAFTGHSTVVSDRATVKRLWSTAAQAFYPQGPDDPGIVALRFEPAIGEMWDGPTMIVSLARMAAAVITGTSADNMGDDVSARIN
ncbi:pyridoxamine 5'-phosphate oxidase family protein [Sandaracinobacteroides saxicola]|uniref:Pyridoxamine 5'-phosphate oxidase family protein n=1 Tax=Sandaracinobacteroides saxicola TaxID=2759707 RepID=A0A7G5IJC4_9SPHN|nr:pyridoxamine 5'-phosphate oxidase family protein [Sandaracinobacteroides saxicola]QMW23466.1 pyridoxamine 5'-phosphate oxidase family protein [Sandaracinobacteroides saxicola]